MRIINAGDGQPCGEPLLISAFLKSNTQGIVDASSVEMLLRCCVCLRGPPGPVRTHTGTECGLLATFNKMRAHVSLRPISVNDGHLDAAPKTKQVTLAGLKAEHDKDMKDIAAVIKALLTRIEALEKSGGGKKRKGTPSTNPRPPPPPPKKTTKANTTGGRKGAGASTTTSKGKGKATDKAGAAKNAAAGGSSSGAT